MTPNPLFKFFHGQPKVKDRLKVSNGDDGSLTLQIYDAIDDWYGVSAEMVTRALAGFDGDTIHVRLNSPGGDVFEARAIMVALVEHSADVIVHIDGLAASAAGFLTLAGKEVKIADGAFLMIHNASSIVAGTAKDMRARAELLDKVEATIVKSFEQRSKATTEQLNSWMNEESWFSAEEALEYGFADEIVPTVEAKARFDLSGYRNTPKSLLEPEVEETPALKSWDDVSRQCRFYEAT